MHLLQVTSSPPEGAVNGPMIMTSYYLPGRCFRLFLLTVCTLILFPGEKGEAFDLGTPVLSGPLQQEKFFDTERLFTGGELSNAAGEWKPQVGLSHAAREDVGEAGVQQTTHRIHGEAGGKLNLLGNVSLTAIARIPLYTYEARAGESSAGGEGKVSTDLMRKPGNISWRSELGVNLGKGVDLNLFYDRSQFGRVDRPGVDERDDKFGTKFIIHF